MKKHDNMSYGITHLEATKLCCFQTRRCNDSYAWRKEVKTKVVQMQTW